ncbi:early nodulin-20-like [Bos indicus x Bos taurus]|uniref:early nodulin-20-like n=1 Tax=Bos indicus x Bos taurus TaxID=30522 RepID=UPI000572E664|nr:early nodulin-20-like [Bos indicus x Bos taurus]
MLSLSRTRPPGSPSPKAAPRGPKEPRYRPAPRAPGPGPQAAASPAPSRRRDRAPAPRSGSGAGAASEGLRSQELKIRWFFGFEDVEDPMIPHADLSMLFLKFLAGMSF